MSTFEEAKGNLIESDRVSGGRQKRAVYVRYAQPVSAVGALDAVLEWRHERYGLGVSRPASAQQHEFFFADILEP